MHELRECFDDLVCLSAYEQLLALGHVVRPEELTGGFKSVQEAELVSLVVDTAKERWSAR
jgi:hypothetical protein